MAGVASVVGARSAGAKIDTDPPSSASRECWSVGRCDVRLARTSGIELNSDPTSARVSPRVLLNPAVYWTQSNLEVGGACGAARGDEGHRASRLSRGSRLTRPDDAPDPGGV